MGGGYGRAVPEGDTYEERPSATTNLVPKRANKSYTTEQDRIARRKY